MAFVCPLWRRTPLCSPLLSQSRFSRSWQRQDWIGDRRGSNTDDASTYFTSDAASGNNLLESVWTSASEPRTLPSPQTPGLENVCISETGRWEGDRRHTTGDDRVSSHCRGPRAELVKNRRPAHSGAQGLAHPKAPFPGPGLDQKVRDTANTPFGLRTDGGEDFADRIACRESTVGLSRHDASYVVNSRRCPAPIL